jgi:hypothetical protein
MPVQTAEFPLIEFQDFLRFKQNLSKSTIRAYTMSLRRLFKHLGEDFTKNPQLLVSYRMSLGGVMRGAMGVAVGHFVDFAKERGIDLAVNIPHIPPIRLPHPAYPFVADIGAAVPLSVAANASLSDLERMHLSSEARTAFSRLRAFADLTGSRATDKALASPYPEWMLELILRAPDTMTSHGIEKPVLRMLEAFTRNEFVTTENMLLVYEVINLNKSKFIRRERFGKTLDVLVESIRTEPWGTHLSDLLEYLRGKEPLALETKFSREEWAWSGGGLVYW